MRRRAAGGVAMAALALLAGLGAGLAKGERVQRGNLIVSLNGSIDPRKLPRDRPAPVALSLAGEIRTADGSPLPRVRRIELALAGRGLLFTRGLPVCPRARLRNANRPQALERCGPALVGRGRLAAEVFVPQQPPFEIESRLLAFNGRTEGGRPAVWMHTFSPNPPVSIVLPFVLRRRPGAFRTALVATVPRSVGPWPHLAGFEMTFSRRFRYRGKLRSYLSASCPVPPSFTAGFLAFARATYSFADGRRLSAETVRSCRAR
jgi:hypothetical protein